MCKRLIPWTMVLITLNIMSPANATTFWSYNSLTFLYGETFQIPMTTTTTDSERLTLTLEHASDNSWGDVFSFLDIEHSTQSHNNVLYGELTPRLSLYKINNYKPKDNVFLQDLLLALNLEYNVNPNGFNFLNTLTGVGTTVKVPGFQFLQLNFYHRHNQRTPDNWQFTPVFGIPFSVGKSDFRIDGWADFVTSTPTTAYNIHTQIQFKWDLGKALFQKKESVYVGTEFKYWKNKFGVTGITETVWQVLAQILI